MARVEEGFATTLVGLSRKNGRLYLDRPDAGEPVAVTVRYLRPLTDRSEIVFLDDKEREVVTVRDLDAIPGESREWVEEALRDRYYLARIERVDEVDVRFGTRYWRVQTDRGPRWFALREPGKNVLWLGDDHLVLRDTAGNRYEIPAVPRLDRRSRRLVRQSL